MSSTIKHTRGKVTLLRSGAGVNTQWTFHLEGQTSDSQQQLIVNSPEVLDDLKSIIGQVERAATVLNLDVD